MKFHYKTYIMILLTIILLVSGCANAPAISDVKKTSTEASGDSLEKDTFNLKEIREFILTANSEVDKINSELNFTSKVIGQIDHIDVVEAIGEYSTFEQVMKLLGEFFVKDVVEYIELPKRYLANINGAMGGMTSTGENFYYMEEKSDFALLVDEKEKKVVEITVFNDSDMEKKTQYTIERLEDGKWKITDETGYFENNRNPRTIEYTDNWNGSEASSSLEKYSANLITDNSEDTAWVEGAKDDGVGEWIVLKSDEKQEISGIQLINGYLKTNDTYYENNRLKKVRVELLDGSFVEQELEDGYFQYQTIDFGTTKNADIIKIIILEVYKGEKYNDTCISEVRVFK